MRKHEITPTQEFVLDPEKAEFYVVNSTYRICEDKRREHAPESVEIDIWRNRRRALYLDHGRYTTNRSWEEYVRGLYSEEERESGVPDQELSHGETWVDIGCGLGVAAVGKTILRPDLRTICIDDKLWVGAGRRIVPNAPGVQFVQSDWAGLRKASPPGIAGFITTFYSALHHYYDEDDLDKVIDGIDYMAKPGAILRAMGSYTLRNNVWRNDHEVIVKLRERNWQVDPVYVNRVGDKTVAGAIRAQKPWGNA